MIEKNSFPLTTPTLDLLLGHSFCRMFPALFVCMPIAFAYSKQPPIAFDQSKHKQIRKAGAVAKRRPPAFYCDATQIVLELFAYRINACLLTIYTIWLSVHIRCRYDDGDSKQKGFVKGTQSTRAKRERCGAQPHKIECENASDHDVGGKWAEVFTLEPGGTDQRRTQSVNQTVVIVHGSWDIVMHEWLHIILCNVSFVFSLKYLVTRVRYYIFNLISKFKMHASQSFHFMIQPLFKQTKSFDSIKKVENYIFLNNKNEFQTKDWMAAWV